jgi:hypothetical protein
MESVKETIEDYPYLSAQIRMATGLNDEAIAKIIRIFENTCSHCLNAEVGCQCWNDE